MTATTKPPSKAGRHRKPPIRLSSMESLGFSNPSSVWSDPPTPTTQYREGRHVAPVSTSDPLADWQPQEFGNRLSGSNFRWSLIAVILLFVGAAGGVGFWLYQRPAAQAEASIAAAMTQAETLRSALPALETFNESLQTGDSNDPTTLFPVDSAARSLFDVSGELDGTASTARSDAAAASGAALDGVRLAGEAHSFRVAVAPILVAPELETDPNLIELDEAARDFGDWQLRFDNVRTALPDGVLSATTDQLDVLSRDLASILTQYVDALRADDQAAAGAVLSTLADRLATVDEQLSASLTDVQQRVSSRIDEVGTVLDRLLDT